MPDNNFSASENAAKFTFFYLLSLAGLLFTALSSGMIIFQIINQVITDVLRSQVYSPEQLKFGVSALVVAAPIYFITTYQIHKNLYSGNLHKDSYVRKWLTYAILLVASLVMLGWVIGIINSFLDGELTARFALKAATAISIAGLIFSFYFYDIRREEVAGRHNKVLRVYFIGAIALVLAVFTASLFFVETPTETRNRKIDIQVLNDFSVIQSAMRDYYDQKQSLPENLDELADEVVFLADENLGHPASGENYEYQPGEGNEFKLCAEFLTSNREDNASRYPVYADQWPHDSGYTCFDLDVKTDNPKGLVPVVPR